MKTTSRIALAAAAGLLLGAAMTPAYAASLKDSGGCCADLEERVAELEATTARKGNRVVSLQVYGQVNKGLLIWDDGIQSDAFVVDNTLASSRFGFVGKATIKPGWTAGYNMEFEIGDSRADEVTQGKTGDEGFNSGLMLRQNYLFIESDKLGRISIGQQSTATDGASEVVLGSSLRSADSNIGAGMCVRTKAHPTACNGRLNTTGDQWAWDYTASSRNDVIRYDTPSIYGFILSASWGDNDYADVALRFKKEFGELRVAAAIGYQWNNQYGVADVYDSVADSMGTDNLDSETVTGSISVAHVPTGLYVAFAAGQRDFKSVTMQDDSFWYLQGGIERKWLPYGTTTVYGEYGQYDGFSKLLVGENNSLNDSQATRVGFGINQKIDSAAMDIYAHATFWSFEDNAAKLSGDKYEDLSTILVGSRIRF